METNKFELKARELRAMLPFASTDETSRAVLRGINVELQPDRTPLLIATDGKRIAVLSSEALILPRKAGKVWLNSKFVKNILRLSPPRPKADLEFRIAGSVITVKIPVGQGRFMAVTDHHSGNPIAYPEWRKVIPDPKTHQANKPDSRIYGLNAKYIADYANVTRIYGMDLGALSINSRDELGPVTIRIDRLDNFFSVLMPVRLTQGESATRPLPDWLGLEAKA